MAVVDHPRKSERALHGLNLFVLGVLTVIFFYPMWHCLMASFSEPTALIGYKGLVSWPIGFSLEGYKTVLNNKNIMIGYGNTLYYLVLGTVINMVLTILGAYALSRRKMMFKRTITLLIVFTMYLDFGLIPSFLNIKELGLYDSRWSILLPGAISTYNLIVLRTAFTSLPPALEESAMIDGANDFTILWRIVLPLSKATLAVVTLFYAVGHWNSWFNASIYLRGREKYPLQLFLREILISSSASTSAGEASSVDGVMYLEELIKYCSIIISTVPILCVYPFAQKYFVSGVMLGSVKE